MPTFTDANGTTRVFDTLPDSTDFRDLLFSPTLVEVPPRVPLDTYRMAGVPVLNQGDEGACTGFGLATVANYLLRRRMVDPDSVPVSPRMMYEMAKRYDEWPGEQYQGSSARGAVKGWHKHGVCREEIWPYHAGTVDREVSEQRANDATKRPLGAYYRVNHKDLVAMHSALVEAGILFATAMVHEGWYRPDEEHRIPPTSRLLGGHAFAIVAYNEDGFWIQNSWGTGWGDQGLALLYYDDWLKNGLDVWVARLGVPYRLQSTRSTAMSLGPEVKRSQAFTTTDIRSHIVSVGNDGQLCKDGTYANDEDDIQGIFEFDFPAMSFDWPKKRLLIYAHGGLVAERGAVQQVAAYRTVLLENQIYPLAFIWKTDYWTTLQNILADALRRRRPEGILDQALEFMLDRLDDALEPLVRALTGKMLWDEMKENGVLATKNERGAGRVVLHHLTRLMAEDPTVEVHIAAHSAGSIFLAPFIQLLTTQGPIETGPMSNRTGHGLPVASCSLWAPAITTDLFKQTYSPSIQAETIQRFALYTLTDRAEQDDDCANIYHKSLLYLVANALEEKHRIPLVQEGEPILGMQKYVEADEALRGLFDKPGADWILSPNTSTEPTQAARSTTHGDFDNDPATLSSTLARILAASESMVATGG